jgi:hypothetical protein
VAFTGPLHGTAVGSAGTIIRTTDGGISWQGVSSGTSQRFWAVDFGDASVGIAVGVGGTIRRTTDGGATWMPVAGDARFDYTGVSLAGADSGVIVGLGLSVKSVVMSTVDGGATWTEADPISDNFLNAVACPSNTSSVAVGSNSTIIGTRSAGVTRMNEWAGVITLPPTCRLYQNYPNPFNPRTTIAFDIPASTHVTLTIFDLLGREVQRLIAGLVTAGYHTVQFDGTELPSGIYFYRLTGGTFVDTKRLIMIR